MRGVYAKADTRLYQNIEVVLQSIWYAEVPHRCGDDDFVVAFEIFDHLGNGLPRNILCRAALFAKYRRELGDSQLAVKGWQVCDPDVESGDFIFRVLLQVSIQKSTRYLGRHRVLFFRTPHYMENSHIWYARVSP